MPTQLAQDDFQRANERPLLDGGNWDISLISESNTAYLELYNKQVYAHNLVDNNAQFWNPSVLVFPDSQYSEITIAQPLSALEIGRDVGPMVRGANTNGALSGYNFKIRRDKNSSGTPIWEYRFEFLENPVEVFGLVQNVPAPAAGDIMRMEIQGQIVSGYINGALVLRVGVGSNVFGNPGICVTGYNKSKPSVASFRAGSLV